MTTRRDFIKATAAVGALGVPEASAQPRRRRAARFRAPYIGVVSSITIDGAFPTSIAGVPVRPMGNLGYHGERLIRAIRRMDQDSDCRLIITLGGNVVFDAANGTLTAPTQKHFISSLGTAPAPDRQSSQFYGGVSLQSAASNPARISWLGTNKAIQPTQIVLFRNLNSSMRATEETGWHGRPGPVSGGNDASGENSGETYAADFRKIPDPNVAVVISADPNFQETKARLVSAANQWVTAPNTTRYVCYPLQDYANAGQTPRRSVLIGPSLSEAYGQLKTMAINFLNGEGPQQIVALTNHTTDYPS